MTLETLVNAAIRMLLIGLVAWLALRLLRVRNPHAETMVWRMLLLAGIGLPVLLYWRLAPNFATSLQLPVIAAGAGSLGGAGHVAPALFSLSGALLAIYLAGALGLLARLAVGLLAMGRVVREARPMPAPDDVRVSTRMASPATFGTTILLPAAAEDWPPGKRDAVLLHERTHVRGHDAHWSWLAQLHAAVFWFSPFAWWLRRRLDALAETTSDDAVIAASHDPLAYAELLLEFADHPNSRSVVMSVAESNVPARIERLLARIPPAAALPRVVRWTAFVLMIPAAVLAASTTRAAAPADAAASPAFHVPQPGTVGIINAADPDEFYPAVAKSEGVTGYAVVKASLDPLGQLIDVVVTEVQPADPRYGFADAAIQVAQRSQYRNETRQVSTFIFMVKFALTAE